MQEVYDFMKKCGVYSLATIDGDQPRVRIFGTLLDYEGKIYIQTGRSKDVYKQIVANPKVELAAYDGKTDWVRVACELVEDPRVEVEAALLDAYPELKAMYAAGDGNTVVFYLKNATATFGSLTGAEPRIVTF